MIAGTANPDARKMESSARKDLPKPDSRHMASPHSVACRLNGDLHMNSMEYKARTRAFAIAVIRQVRRLPPTLICRVLGAQLVRSAGGTAANYRAACRGRSRAEFVAKLGNVLEEADESALWLDVLVESGEHVPVETLRSLQREAEEIVAMTVTSITTAARKLPLTHPAHHVRRHSSGT
jgi:four helix bundle protein